MLFSRQSSGITLLLTAGMMILSSLQVIDAKCEKVNVRKEIRDLTQPEFNRFIEAIKKLKSGPSPSKYDKYAEIHLRYQVDIHNGAMFFPWHRKAILEFEKDLQQIDPSVTLPYWQWSADADYPHNSPVLQPAMMGGNSFAECLNNGPFAGWTRPYPAPGCLRRGFNLGSAIGSFFAPRLISLFTSRATGYDEFRAAIELGPHPGPHFGIGQDMTGMNAPADPMFFLHHGYIDKIWYDWQVYRKDHLYKYDGIHRGKPVSLDDPIIYYTNTTVRDVMDIDQLCYRYEPMKSTNVATINPPPGMIQVKEQNVPGSGQGNSTAIHLSAASIGSPSTPATPIPNAAPAPITAPASVSPVAQAPLGGSALVRRADDLHIDESLQIIGRVTERIISRITRLLHLTPDEIHDIAKDLQGELKAPSPIPDAFCKMNKYDIQEVRAQEAAVKELVEAVNKVFKSIPSDV
ncbi:MAG: hypothetical protein DHS80DRAFT_22283 [Piptocephalis tieghemiana]|nr:MAG: hypothetical protein DHS80DRAFT_22283 [Piptocephalis tieghemiana]